MKTSLMVAALVVGGCWMTAPRAFAQNTTLETSDAVPLDASGEPGWNNGDGSLDDAQPIQQPTTAAPTDTPKLPSNIPPPPGAQQNAQQQQQVAQQQQQVTTYASDDGSDASNVNSGPGQWVFTQQYGWVYAPYDRSYTYVTDDVSAASMYVYRPVTGWAWLGAPWVISVGPRPYWGNYGPYRYSYYSHPWFRPRYGSVHYYGRPNYGYHAAPAPRAHYYYRGNVGGGGGGRIRGGIGGAWHGGGHGGGGHGGGGHHR